MLTPAQIEGRQRIQDEERRLERIAGGEVCAECGHGLITPWNPDKNRLELRCGKDRNHQGHIRLDPELDRLYRMRQAEIDRGRDTKAVDAEIQQLQIKQQSRKGRNTMADETALAEYKERGLIAQDRAMDIIRTTPGWGKAPVDVVKRAAMVCSDYRLFPGIHVFLIAFNEGKPNETWAVVMGIKTNRLLASRRKPYKYTDGPRIAEEAEAKAHFKTEYNPDLLYAVCRGEGLDGSAAEGWGWWKRADTPYGVDKGNSKANMVEIRAERRFLDRLCPGEMPTGVDVVDESFVGAPSDITIREVDQGTGEIIEEGIVSPPEPKDTELHHRPGEQLTGDAYVPSSNGLPKAEKEKTTSPEPQPPKSKDESRKMGKDPTVFKPKNQADLVGGARYYFQKEPSDVASLFGGTTPSDPGAIPEAWDAIVGKWGKGEEQG